MTLYIIGLGLFDAKDITVKGLAAVKKCNILYLEDYTSQFHATKEELEKFYGEKIQLADRQFTEIQTDNILKEAKEKNVGFLVIGAPFSATTHMELFLEAKKRKIPVEVIENASVLTAVGIAGLSLYKFGRTTTIPFENKHITSPYEIILQNKKMKLHTLCLLDIQGGTLMTIRDGLDYLIRCGLKKDERIVGCGALGSSEPEIKVGNASHLTVKKFPQCIIIPGELHFKEEEVLQCYS
jgi:diphthine synthase